MRLNARPFRLLATIIYFVVAYATLSLYVAGSSFCSPSRTGQSRAVVTAKLAFACTLWDIVASLCGVLVLRMLRRKLAWPAVVATTLVAGCGFASVPFWIYRGYGGFLLENTWADVSCFFTEGYGAMFPFIVVPVLVLATLIREWITLKIQRVGMETPPLREQRPSLSS
jgi:hypothetical protein